LGASIFQRREREICHRRSTVEEFVAPGIHPIVVERLKNPVILPLETHLAGIAPQAKKEFDNLEAFGGRF
jgi:hypothetical protein